MKSNKSSNECINIRKGLEFQFNIAWKLLNYHLSDLGDKECLWKPNFTCLSVNKKAGVWVADWPSSEGYDIGPANIAWLTWHIIFWWSMAIDYSFGNATLIRENVLWPGNVKLVKDVIWELHNKWMDSFGELSDDEICLKNRTKWPFEDMPFYDLFGWMNLELMKNASEIGYCRFLYGASNKQAR